MRKTFGFIAALAAGYFLGALFGALAVTLTSSNAHDTSVEAAMTGAFVTGPLGAVVALLGAFLRRRRPTA